jgi:hypothetical protein
MLLFKRIFLLSGFNCTSDAFGVPHVFMNKRIILAR